MKIEKTNQYWFSNLKLSERIDERNLSKTQLNIIKENKDLEYQTLNWLGFYNKNLKCWDFLKNGQQVYSIYKSENGYKAREYLFDFLNNKK